MDIALGHLSFRPTIVGFAAGTSQDLVFEDKRFWQLVAGDVLRTLFQQAFVGGFNAYPKLHDRNHLAPPALGRSSCHDSVEDATPSAHIRRGYWARC